MSKSKTNQKMILATVLLSLVLFMSPPATEALGCKGGFSGLTTMYSVIDEVYDIGCEGSHFDGQCYAMYVEPGNFWDHGCIEKKSFNECDKSFHEYGVDKYYCCCTDENCNDKYFAIKCEKKMKAMMKSDKKKAKAMNEILEQMVLDS